MPSYLNENPVIAPRLGVHLAMCTRISRLLAAACMLDSVLPMTTLSSRSVVVAIVAGALGFPRLAWSAPPPPSTAFLSIPLSQKTSRGCHKRALPTTPPSSCSVSEANDRQARTPMATGPSGRRTRGALAASNDRGAMGTDEHATWDDQTVT